MGVTLRKEHEDIRRFMDEIEALLNSEDVDCQLVVSKFRALGTFWDDHERREEIFFEIRKSPFEKTFIEQHRQLKGHWTVLNRAIISKDDLKLRTAFETDGLMLISQLRKHMDEEDKLFA